MNRPARPLAAQLGNYRQRQRTCKCKYCAAGTPLNHGREFNPIPSIIREELKVGFGEVSEAYLPYLPSTSSAALARDSLQLTKYDHLRNINATRGRFPRVSSLLHKLLNKIMKRTHDQSGQITSGRPSGRPVRPGSEEFHSIDLDDFGFAEVMVDMERVNSIKTPASPRVALGQLVTKTHYGYCWNCGTENKFEVAGHLS